MLFLGILEDSHLSWRDAHSKTVTAQKQNLELASLPSLQLLKSSISLYLVLLFLSEHGLRAWNRYRYVYQTLSQSGVILSDRSDLAGVWGLRGLSRFRADSGQVLSRF